MTRMSQMRVFGFMWPPFLTLIVDFSSTNYLPTAKDFAVGDLRRTINDCKRMGKAMYNAYNVYSDKASLIIDHKIHLSEDEDIKTAVRGRLRINTGVNFDNLTQVEDFACELSNVKSIKDLSRMLPLAEHETEEMYTHVRDTLNIYGGSEGLQKHLNVIVDIVPTVQKIGFPDWPLQCSNIEEVEYFIQKMIDSYGNDFLTSLAEGTPDSIVLDNDIIIKDAGQFAHNLCESDNLWEFAANMDYNLHEMESLFWYLDEYMDPEQYKALVDEHKAFIRLVKQFETFGLLNLQ